MARKSANRKKIFRPQGKTPGLPPGSLVYTGDAKPPMPRVTMLDYDEHKVVEKELVRVDDCIPFKDAQTVTWINVDSVTEPGLLENFGRVMGFHGLMLEDILNTDQRPKFEDYGNYIYIVVKMLDFDARKGEIETEQLSLILGPNYVISFQERAGDFFDPLRERIRRSLGRVRKLGTDYLAYAILDVIVDHYFAVLEKLGEKIEQLEDSVITDPREGTARAVHAVRREMIFVRKSVWPLREVITSLQRSESALIRESNAAYFRDLQDHIMRVTDGVDTFRDLLNGMLDSYYSTITTRTNSVVKVLTLFSAIFMPLTFITGIFGMNFRNFPELEWHYGFQGTLILMVIVIATMVAIFRWKKWL
ncbi:MAG TPA: magnesium/cobalt transporter CorA [Burkholderiales bacterium]|nr:magnesium/cobalt transporter CorA [Burkholderiales bacterium]